MGERRRKMQVIENKFQKVTRRAKTFATYCKPRWGFWKMINPRRIPICSHFLIYAFSLAGGRECSLFITVESIQPGHPRSDYLIEVTAWSRWKLQWTRENEFGTLVIDRFKQGDRLIWCRLRPVWLYSSDTLQTTLPSSRLSWVIPGSNHGFC